MLDFTKSASSTCPICDKRVSTLSTFSNMRSHIKTHDGVVVKNRRKLKKTDLERKEHKRMMNKQRAPQVTLILYLCRTQKKTPEEKRNQSIKDQKYVLEKIRGLQYQRDLHFLQK
jgi:beta-lactamase class D